MPESHVFGKKINDVLNVSILFLSFCAAAFSAVAAFRQETATYESALAPQQISASGKVTAAFVDYTQAFDRFAALCERQCAGKDLADAANLRASKLTALTEASDDLQLMLPARYRDELSLLTLAIRGIDSDTFDLWNETRENLHLSQSQLDLLNNFRERLGAARVALSVFRTCEYRYFSLGRPMPHDKEEACISSTNFNMLARKVLPASQ
jgi:hypothetical protein